MFLYLGIMQSFFFFFFFLQTDSWACQPLPQFDQHEAPGVGHPVVHREARDVTRPRILSLALRVLQGQGWKTPHAQGGKRKTKPQRRVSLPPTCVLYSPVTFFCLTSSRRRN